MRRDVELAIIEDLQQILECRRRVLCGPAYVFQSGTAINWYYKDLERDLYDLQKSLELYHYFLREAVQTDQVQCRR
jgi:hypothetical protein